MADPTWYQPSMQISKWQRAQITAVMALVFVAEHADLMILSAMYLPISRTLHIGVAKLGTLSMYRGIVSVSHHGNCSWCMTSAVYACRRQSMEVWGGCLRQCLQCRR